MIILGSRYENEAITPALLPNGSIKNAVLRTRLTTGTITRYHIWSDSDRIDLVAERYYGSGSQWYRIMDANPELLDPLGISPGTMLSVPNAA